MCDNKKIDSITTIFCTGFIIVGILFFASIISSCDTKQKQITANAQVEIAKAQATNSAKEVKVKVNTE